MSSHCYFCVAAKLVVDIFQSFESLRNAILELVITIRENYNF